jgi:hypothetical protein
VWTCVLKAPHFERIRESLKISSAAHRPDGVHLRVVSPERPIDSAVEAEPMLEDAFLLLMNGEARSTA